MSTQTLLHSNDMKFQHSLRVVLRVMTITTCGQIVLCNPVLSTDLVPRMWSSLLLPSISKYVLAWSYHYQDRSLSLKLSTLIGPTITLTCSFARSLCIWLRSPMKVEGCECVKCKEALDRLTSGSIKATVRQSSWDVAQPMVPRKIGVCYVCSHSSVC